MRPPFVLLIVASSSIGVACDSADPAKPVATVAAEAPAEDPELDERVAERREQRLAEQKAKEDEAAEQRAALEAVAILPAALPKQLDPACTSVGEAQDAFMQRMFADDPETLDKWATASNTQIPLTVATCKKTGSIEAAACQLHALEHAPPELKKELPQLLRTCIDKYAPGAPGGVLPPG